MKWNCWNVFIWSMRQRRRNILSIDICEWNEIHSIPITNTTNIKHNQNKLSYANKRLPHPHMNKVFQSVKISNRRFRLILVDVFICIFFCHFAKTHSTHSTEKCLMCLPWNLNQSTYKLRFQLVHLRCITNNLINVHIQIFLVIFIFFDVIQFHFFCLRRIEWLQTKSFFFIVACIRVFKFICVVYTKPFNVHVLLFAQMESFRGDNKNLLPVGKKKTAIFSCTHVY